MEKTFAHSLMTIKAVDDEQRVIEGIASTPRPDRMDDVVEPMGAQFSLPLPLLLRHASNESVGDVIAAKPNADGIPFRARLKKPEAWMPQSLRDRLDLAWAEVKSGLIKGVSIGFRALETADIKNSFGVRFTKWEWLELSLVTIPANSDATIQSIKSIDAKDLRAALGRNAAFTLASTQTRPGASGTSPKGTGMKTMKQLQDDRERISARLQELDAGCGGDPEALSADEQKEFDELQAELKVVDKAMTFRRTVDTAAKGAVEITADVANSDVKSSQARGRVHAQPKQKSEPGIAFAQYVKLMYRAKGIPFVALQMAERNNQTDRRVVSMLKAAVGSGMVNGSTTAGDWGMELVGTETGAVADFIEFLRPATILGKFGTGGVPSLRRVPFRVPLVGMTDGGDGYWVGEGKGKPLTSFAFSRTTLEPLKVAAICVLTQELLADSSPAADGIVRDQLRAALTQRVDIDFIDRANSGTAGTKPAAITNGVTPIPATGTGDAADVRADVKAAISAFFAANNTPSSGVWIMPSQVALSLSLMMNPLGQPEFGTINMNGGTFAGLPVIVSDNVPTVTAGADVVLVNAQDIYFGDDGDVRVDTSEHASIEMSDNPEGETGTVVSMYQTNRVAFRAERRLDWMRRREESVQVITGVNWGAA